jgi:hypothetical protein
MLIEIKRFNSFIDLDIVSSNMYVFRVVEESNIVSHQSLPHDDTLAIRSHIWLLNSNITYDLLDCELSFHLKSIAVKGNKLEFFMDFHIALKGPIVLKAVGENDIASQQQGPL